MNAEHLDIGIIQSFLDGELANGEMSRVSNHITGCDPCAIMLAEAEDESAIVFPALEREFDTLVPTHRLWTRINESIAIEKQQAPWWQKAYALVVAGLASPSIAIAAGLLIVVGVFAALMIKRAPVTGDMVFTPARTTSAPTPQADEVSTDKMPSTQAPPVVRAAYRDERDFTPQRAPLRVSASPSAMSHMPGEESYVKTIASLSRTVNGQKDDGIMRPSQRVSYERDMAVVNDAIGKMRTELKKNPRNESAKQVLYSSYQNKIDLLNSVAQKEELVASLK